MIVCIILFSRNEKKTFLSTKEKSGESLCAFSKVMSTSCARTRRALDDEEVKEDKEEELEDVLHHH